MMQGQLSAMEITFLSRTNDNPLRCAPYQFKNFYGGCIQRRPVCVNVSEPAENAESQTFNLLKECNYETHLRCR